jgi:hypothetical protein
LAGRDLRHADEIKERQDLRFHQVRDHRRIAALAILVLPELREHLQRHRLQQQVRRELLGDAERCSQRSDQREQGRED